VTKKLGLRAYARHRKERGLPGQSHGAVRKAIDREALVRAVSYDAKNRALIDPAIADEEWSERTDPVQQREPDQARGRFSDGEDAAEQGALFPDARVPLDRDPPGKPSVGPSLKQSQAVRVAFQARLAQLDYEERSGRLCQLEVVKVEAFRLGRVVRDKILNVADRLCAQMAAESDTHVCRELLLRELNVALQELVEAGKKEYGTDGLG